MERVLLVIGSSDHSQVNGVLSRLDQKGTNYRFVDYSSSCAFTYDVFSQQVCLDGEWIVPLIVWAADKYTAWAYGTGERWVNARSRDLEWRSIVRNFYHSTDGQVYNPPHAIYFEDRKIEQLRVASRLGLRCPTSACTNAGMSVVRNRAGEFGEFVYKPIGIRHYPIMTSAGGLRTFVPLPKAIDECAFAGDGERPPPVFVQQRLRPQFDIRLIIISSETFCFSRNSIATASTEIHHLRDGRPPIFERVTLPTDIIEAAKGFLSYFNLFFGHFDFMAEENGDLFFLECNPNGIWYNFDSEGSVAEAFATFLDDQLNRALQC
jgi:hypothetical protein